MVKYLDYAATTPLDPKVREVMLYYFDVEFGNAGSRTHEYGQRAKKAVNNAREQVAAVINAQPDEVIFTSGATEANNIATLGLEDFGRKQGKMHIISTAIEHKAILEPLEELERRGFEVTLIKPNSDGLVEVQNVLNALRSDTLLVSVMHVNNETGMIQPLEEIAEGLKDHEAFFHTDAAQGYGKDLAPLKNKRIDLISVSGHKIYGPKGVGALIVRRRRYKRIPLTPLMFGGGQERGLRPGTLPVPLIAGFGEAAEQCIEQYKQRIAAWGSQKEEFIKALSGFDYSINGILGKSLPNILNFRICGVDSEAVLLSLKDQVAISNGSACTSANYTPSHVLTSMGQNSLITEEAIRVSFSTSVNGLQWGKVLSSIVNIN